MGSDEVVYAAFPMPSRETVASTAAAVFEEVMVPVGMKPEPLVFVTPAVSVIDLAGDHVLYAGGRLT